MVFPPGQRVVYERMGRASDIPHQMWMLEGVMDISCGDSQWRLEAGECVAMRADQQIIYANPGSRAARYLVVW